MRFEELRVRSAEGELALRFHPHLTVLAGLAEDERRSFVDTLLGALAGGPEETLLRCRDAAEAPLEIVGRDGRVTARCTDGTPVAEPVGSFVSSADELRALMVVGADEAVPVATAPRPDEPPALQALRAELAAVGEELAAAEARRAETADLHAELERLDGEIERARALAARRAHAAVLAALERVRAEVAAVRSDRTAVEADRRLLADAPALRALVRDASQAMEAAVELRELAGDETVDEVDRVALALVPEAPPADLGALVAALQSAEARRCELDARLQELATASLPAPSAPIVSELGLLDQPRLWATADELARALEALEEIEVELGGLDVAASGETSVVVAEIEAAHAAREEVDAAAEAVRQPALTAALGGLLAVLLGLVTTPVLVALGGLLSAGAGVVGFALPNRRRAAAVRAEADALARADASSYLGYHLRRVHASVDPRLRAQVEEVRRRLREARDAWTDLVGAEVRLDDVRPLEAEIRAYHDAVERLGSTADEMAALRRELDDVAIPAWIAAREALCDACAPYEVDLDELPAEQVAAAVEARCRQGAAARALGRLHEAEAQAERALTRLTERLTAHGFDSGELDERVRTMEWAVARAEEREAARRRARPTEELEAEIRALSAEAERLRQPGWDSAPLGPDEAGPSVEELEAARAQVLATLEAAGGRAHETDELLARHRTLTREVAEAEVALGAASAPPIHHLEEALAARLARAAQAGPAGDPVPVLLDDALTRVPPDRVWDLLDALLRLAAEHQVVYLTEDAFVAAWARSQVLEGTIALLEASPEGA